MKINLFLFLLLLLSQVTHAQNPQYAPRDETYSDPELATFVSTLLEAIDARDQNAFYALLDMEVLGSFGSEGSMTEFKDIWHTDKDSSIVWPLMKRVIELGGVFLNDTADQSGRYPFVFPYVYDMPLDVEDDYYSIGVVTGKNVNLRDKPDTASPIKIKLTYDVIWFLDGEQYGKTKSGLNHVGEPEWYLVETYDRQHRGWINWRYVYSPVSYRMFLYKNTHGAWKISAFLAGD